MTNFIFGSVFSSSSSLAVSFFSSSIMYKHILKEKELLVKMHSDTFYYGELGRNALSSSAIKQLLDSPKSYERSLNFKQDNPAFKTGRLIHLAALEPDKLESLVTIVEVQSALTKKYKEKVIEVGSSEFVYTRKEYDKAMYSVDALLQNEMWQRITRKAEFEVPAVQMLHGYAFRAKADVLGPNYVADLKTSSDIKGFPYAAKKYGYDVQLYLYSELFSVSYDKFYFFVICKKTGDLGIWDCKESFYNSGKEKVMRAIKTFEEYFVNNESELNEYVLRGTLE